MSSSGPSSAQLAVLYEHPQWFQPLFAALERHGLPYVPVQLAGHSFDPASTQAPAPLILSRVAQSSFLREPEHPIFYADGSARSLGTGRRARAQRRRSACHRFLQGAAALAHRIARPRDPETRIVHRAHDLAAAAESMTFPLMVKANIGGSGAGIVRYSSLEELRARSLTAPRRRRSIRCCWSRITCLRAAGRSLASRRWAAVSSTRSKSKPVATASISARPTPASPSPARGYPHDGRHPVARDHRGGRAHRPGGRPRRRRRRIMVDDRDGTPRFYDIKPCPISSRTR